MQNDPLGAGRRATDQAIYTQADLDRIRQADRDENRYSALAGQVGKLEGTVESLPAQFEARARQVFAEQMAELRKEQGNRNWRAADTLIALGQFLLAAGVVAVAIK